MQYCRRTMQLKKQRERNRKKRKLVSLGSRLRLENMQWPLTPSRPFSLQVGFRYFLPFQYSERVVLPLLSLMASLLYAALALTFYFEILWIVTVDLDISSVDFRCCLFYYLLQNQTRKILDVKCIAQVDEISQQFCENTSLNCNHFFTKSSNSRSEDLRDTGRMWKVRVFWLSAIGLLPIGLPPLELVQQRWRNTGYH